MKRGASTVTRPIRSRFFLSLSTMRTAQGRCVIYFARGVSLGVASWRSGPRPAIAVAHSTIWTCSQQWLVSIERWHYKALSAFILFFFQFHHRSRQTSSFPPHHLFFCSISFSIEFRHIPIIPCSFSCTTNKSTTSFSYEALYTWTKRLDISLDSVGKCCKLNTKILWSLSFVAEHTHKEKLQTFLRLFIGWKKN